MNDAVATPRSALVIGADRAFGEQIVKAIEMEAYRVAISPADAGPTLDVLVFNSPVAPRRIRFRAMTDAEFAGPLEEHLVEFVAAVQFAAPRMEAGGAIVQVTSKAHLGTWDGVDVAAAGGACVAMARSMALELAGLGIRVNTLSADFVGQSGADKPDCESLAATVVWLAGPASRLITGETILLDQGRSLQMALAARQ